MQCRISTPKISIIASILKTPLSSITSKNRPRRSDDDHLCPMLTDTRLSRLRRHHCSTSDVQVALKNALRTLEPEQARNTWASCSLKPVLPSSNSLSDSSTTNHSTLNRMDTHQMSGLPSLLFETLCLSVSDNERPHLLRSRAGGSCLSRKMSLFGVLTRMSAEIQIQPTVSLCLVYIYCNNMVIMWIITV